VLDAILERFIDGEQSQAKPSLPVSTRHQAASQLVLGEYSAGSQHPTEDHHVFGRDRRYPVTSDGADASQGRGDSFRPSAACQVVLKEKVGPAFAGTTRINILNSRSRLLRQLSCDAGTLRSWSPLKLRGRPHLLRRLVRKSRAKRKLAQEVGSGLWR
jgi:hypothetical protein